MNEIWQFIPLKKGLRKRVIFLYYSREKNCCFLCRFFGNRSYCYDRMGQYEKALQDADVAISLAPDWPKGYFRRGRALAGLKVLFVTM